MSRPMRRSLLAAAMLGVMVGVSRPAEAEILASYTSPSSNYSAGTVVGESATTTTGGPFDNIAFNFYTVETSLLSPFAEGHLFILTQEYLGTPSAWAHRRRASLPSPRGSAVAFTNLTPQSP